MQSISIQQVLSEIETAPQPFLIKFVRGTGKKRGSIKTVAKAVKGAPKGRIKARTGQSIGLHKERHTIPITDLETNEYLSPLISHIIQFNQFKVFH